VILFVLFYLFSFKLLARLKINGLPVLEGSYMMMLDIALMKSCLFTKSSFLECWIK